MSDMAHRGAQPASIEYQANRPWKVILPPVYRYLPTQYVDQFFETGTLRLSSFAQFSRHADEARGDQNEGRGMVSSQGGGRQFFAHVVGGEQSYVLCGSFILSRSILEQFSGCDAAFEIANVPDFAMAIARQLAGFTHGVSGYCIYADNRILVRHMDGDPFPVGEDEQISIERMMAAAQAAGQDEHLFLKESRYAYQAEYRMMWHLDKAPQEALIVVAPEARQFCRRISSDEIR